MSITLSNTVCLHDFLLAEKHLDDKTRNDLTRIFGQISLASKVTANAIRRAALEGNLGLAGETNVQGEDVKKLDIVANDAFRSALTTSERVCVMTSEEDDDILVTEEAYSGDYVVCFDPLDGSSNLDANVSVGSIYGIWRRKSSADKTANIGDALQKGADQIASGYSLYGASTMLVITTGRSVDGFTLDASLGEFVLTHRDIKISSNGSIYSVNEGNSVNWSDGVKNYVAAIKGGDGRKAYSQRYIGSMVGDVHRTLLYGGLFMYPADKKSPKGKLRYLYEVAPLSLLMEVAGGAAVDGVARSLDYTPTTIHERVPVFMGSKDLVNELLTFTKSD